MKLSSYNVFLNNFNLSIRLGCQPSERQHYQTAALDLTFDVPATAGNFELDKTVCYLTASQIATDVAAAQEWDLIENFLSALAERLFARFTDADKISLSLKKFVVPGADSAGAALEFLRG